MNHIAYIAYIAYISIKLLMWKHVDQGQYLQCGLAVERQSGEHSADGGKGLRTQSSVERILR